MTYVFCTTLSKPKNQMKQLFTCSLILICFINASAQLKKGNRLINGTLSGSVNKQDLTGTSGASDYKTSSLSIQPRIGFFASDKTVVGFGIGYDYSKTNYPYTNGPGNFNRMFTFSISPFVRRYFSMGDKVAFFLDGRLNVGFGKTRNTSSSFNTTTGIYSTYVVDDNTFKGGLAFKPGIAFFLTEKWSAEATFATLGFDYSKANSSNSKTYAVNMNYGGLNAFAFGVSYYINR
jgi:outer membrane immunogenic protein